MKLLNASVRFSGIFLNSKKLLGLDFLPAAEQAKISPVVPPGFVFAHISIKSGGNINEIVTVF